MAFSFDEFLCALDSSRGSTIKCSVKLPEFALCNRPAFHLPPVLAQMRRKEVSAITGCPLLLVRGISASDLEADKGLLFRMSAQQVGVRKEPQDLSDMPNDLISCWRHLNVCWHWCYQWSSVIYWRFQYHRTVVVRLRIRTYCNATDEGLHWLAYKVSGWGRVIVTRLWGFWWKEKFEKKL